MRSQPFLVVSVLVGALAPTNFATTGDRGALHQQSAIVKFERPTWVVTEMLIGAYVIVHDNDMMTRGEPCTTLYRIGTRARPLEEVVAFHCIPHERTVARNFTIAVDPNPALGMDTLIEYQFAGDSEAHGVPLVTRTSNRGHVRVPPVCVRRGEDRGALSHRDRT